MIKQMDYIFNKIKFITNYNPTYFHQELKRQLLNWFCPKINDNLIANKSNWNEQIGGQNNIELIQKYKGYKFKINIEKGKTDTIINILTFEQNPQQCSVIVVDRVSKIAILQNLSYFNKCTEPDLIENKGGSTILNFLLGFLRLTKKKLDINKIVLKDNSFKYCKHCSQNVKLSTMYFLLYGNTWYGKYGFRPYDEREDKPDLFSLKFYNRNQKIIANTKLKDIDILKYIEEEITKNKLQGINISKFKKLINTYHDILLSEFLRAMLKEYNKYCCLFAQISLRIYAKLNLQNYHGSTFYLNI